MDQPLEIGNVHNMSLESFNSSNNEQPHLMARFSCESTAGHECIYVTVESDAATEVCCSAVQLYDSHNITLKGISVTTQISGMSGIISHDVSKMNIQWVTTSSLRTNMKFGIVISDAIMVEVYSSYTANFSRGFVFQRTISTLITNITATHSSYYGISLVQAANNTIICPKAMNNVVGIALFTNTNITIIDALVVHNDVQGMNLISTTDVTIINPTAMFNGKDGINMIQTHNTSIINATVIHNSYSGITMVEAINSSIVNISMQGSEMSIIMEYISISSSSHTSIFNSSFTGIGTVPNAASASDPTSHPAVIALYDSSLNVSGCAFIGNSVSAVKAYASNITAAGHLIFCSNRATAGTAFILIQNSILRLTENNHIHFNNNHAINSGGVFYITNNVYYNTKSYIYMNHGHPLLQSTCFLNVKEKR